MAQTIISMDDHVVEPQTLWTARVPAKFLDIAPRVEHGSGMRARRDAAGRLVFDEDPDRPRADWWIYEDARVPVVRSFAAAGYSGAELDMVGMTYEEMRPGCYDPAARIADMDLNAVQASLCFPNLLPRFCGQAFLEARDRDLAMICVRAYNDWLFEEWCAVAPERLFPACIVPLWDPKAAAEEIHRSSRRGGRAITFPELPTRLGLPSIHDRDGYWDPVFQACDETGTLMCVHLGSSSTITNTSPDAPKAVSASTVMVNPMLALADWLFSGVFERYPRIKMLLSEAEIGWIPCVLERADRKWEEFPSYYNHDAVRRPPSEYYYDHVFPSFISDQHGLDSLSKVGADNITFEVDYPHGDSTWPNTQDVVAKQFAHLTEGDREKILYKNAARLLGL
jgi:predicted TIM-barrel fold metal-dependent hydrolase